MKKILGTAVIISAVIVGGYFSTGLITERTLKKNIKAWNQVNGTEVNLTSYDRGLFRSHADLTWHVQTPEKISQDANGQSVIVPPKNYTFEVPLVIYHGPVMIQNGRLRFGLGAATGELSLPEGYQEDFATLFTDKSTKPKLFVRLFVSYLNKTHIEADVPHFELFTKEHDTQLEWLGMESDLRFSPESTHLQGHLLLDGLRIIGQHYRVIINKLATAYDVHKDKSGLFLGDAHMKLPVLQITTDGNTELEVKQLELRSTSDVNNKLFESSFRGAFAGLISRENQYGPAELELSVRNIDAQTFADLKQRLNEMQHMNTTGVQAQQLLLSVLPDIPKLLEKGAVFEISKLKVVLAQGGDIEGAINIAFPKQAEQQQPLQVLPKIKGVGHLHMPHYFLKTLLTRAYKDKLMKQDALPQNNTSANKAADVKQDNVATSDNITDIPATQNKSASLDDKAAKEAEMRIAELIRVGALQAKGSDYVLELKLSSGRLLVNGHPFHSGMLNF